MKSPEVYTHRRMLRLPEVMAYVGHGRSWIYREMAQGRFVQAVKCGRSTVWDSALIEAWVAEKLAGQAQSVEG